MRSLVKSECPEILADNAEDWTNDLLAVLGRGEDPTATQKTRYNHQDIKGAIVAETHGKCAYCESKIRHVDYGDIEHLVPKAKVPALAFAWPNLTLACRVCNVNKGDFYNDEDDHTGLIDPYVDEPLDHLMFFREQVLARPDSDKGILTEATINLTRNELVERRKERMDFVDGMVGNYLRAPAHLKPIFLQDIQKKCLDENAEYLGVVSDYLKQLEARGVMPAS